MTRLLVAALFLGRLVKAQGIDSIIAASYAAGIPSWSGVLQPLGVATIPGWINTVVAVRFEVPNTGLPGIADMVFRLALPVTSQIIPVTIYFTPRNRPLHQALTGRGWAAWADGRTGRDGPDGCRLLVPRLRFGGK